ncbi:PH domain-containing protein [soil metagenome]
MADKKSSRRARLLLEGKFDPKLKTYFYVGTILFCLITIVGIVVLPFWLIFGKKYINRYFEMLTCDLTTRALHYKKGIWFQTERTIPLDKIQDLTFKEGPILRYFGLSQLKVETAGQSAQGSADLSLIGLRDARAFREAVLDQRDEITDRNYTESSPTSNGEQKDHELTAILSDIHTTLKKIEQKL